MWSPFGAVAVCVCVCVCVWKVGQGEMKVQLTQDQWGDIFITTTIPCAHIQSLLLQSNEICHSGTHTHTLTHRIFWQGTHSLFPFFFFFSPIKTKLSIFIWRNFISDSLECSHTHSHVKWWNDLQSRAVMQIKIPHDYCQRVRSVKSIISLWVIS